MNSESCSFAESVRGFVRLLVPGLFALLCDMQAGRSEEPPAPKSVRASDESVVSIEKVEVGFRGWSKVGEWTPLWLTLKSPVDRQVTIVINAPDPDDNLAMFPREAVALKGGVQERIESCYRTGRLNGDLHVQVNDAEGHRLISRRLSPGREIDAACHPALKLDTPLWISLGRWDSAEADGVSAGAGGSSKPLVVGLDSLANLPTDWHALQSVEMVILPTGRQAGGGTSLLAQISAERDAVLRNWVRMGGHLVISVASQVADFQMSPLATWKIPVAVEGQFSLRQLSSLENYSGLNVPLRISGTIPAARLSKPDQAHILVRDSGSQQPLVASVPFGFGRVTLMGVDIDAPPLAGWEGLESVLQRVAGTGAGSAGAAARKVNRQLTHVGVSDLATQFQQTHEDFPAVSRPSYWSVMGMILVYVAVIGPLDYMLVHRVLRRPEWTWFTFLVMVTAGVALAAWTAGRVNGSSLQVNQFDLIDVDTSTGATRNNTWTSLYSPEHRRYSIAVKPLAASGSTVTEQAVRMSWCGAPENSVGGMYRTGAAGYGGRSYRFSTDAADVENFPAAHWSTKSLSANWSGELEAPVIDAHLENLGTGQLRGSLTLLLDEPLEDCLLVANGWAYIPTTADATLKPGIEWHLRGDRNVRQRDLKALLTGEKQTRRKKGETTGAVTSTEITTTIEPYQPLGRNRSQQVAMLTFHEAIGGNGYTGLSNAALRDLELTDLMKLGRAVLIGRVATSPARVVVDGQPAEPASRSTWIRLVLPVIEKERLIEKTIPKASENPEKSRIPTGSNP